MMTTGSMLATALVLLVALIAARPPTVIGRFAVVRQASQLGKKFLDHDCEVRKLVA